MSSDLHKPFQAGKLILASSSPRRRELIHNLRLRLPIEIRSSEADETMEPYWMPGEAVEQLALRKAAAVALQYGDTDDALDTLVIGADTIVVLDGEMLGKPANEEEAKAVLRRLQGNSHEVYSGLALVKCGPVLDTNRIADVVGGPLDSLRIERYVASGAAVSAHTVSRVTFRPMSEDEINGYVATGEPLDKAGSYGVQGLGAVFVDRIEGDFYSIMGLPLNLLYRMLLPFKVSPFDGAPQSADRRS